MTQLLKTEILYKKIVVFIISSNNSLSKKIFHQLSAYPNFETIIGSQSKFVTEFPTADIVICLEKSKVDLADLRRICQLHRSRLFIPAPGSSAQKIVSDFIPHHMPPLFPKSTRTLSVIRTVTFSVVGLIVFVWGLLGLELIALIFSLRCTINYTSNFCISSARLSLNLIDRTFPFAPGSQAVATALGLPFRQTSSYFHRYLTAVRSLAELKSTLSSHLSYFFSANALQPTTESLNRQINTAHELYSLLQTDLKSLYFNSSNPPAHIEKWAELVNRTQASLAQIQLLAPLLSRLLSHQHTQYLVLIQDNSQARPSGGVVDFIVAIDVVQNKPAKVQIFSASSPPIPLAGISDPPLSYKSATNQNSWDITQAGWDPDFTQAADKIVWFAKKQFSLTPDVVITVNLSTLERLLSLIGPVEISAGRSISPDNFWDQYPLLRDRLSDSALATQFIQSVFRRLSDLSQHQPDALLGFIHRELLDRELYLIPKTFTSPEASQLGWDGSIAPTPCQTHASCVSDRFSFFDSFISANIQPSALTRNLDLSVNIEPPVINSTYSITYRNASSFKIPNYYRFYLPPSAVIDSFSLNSQEIDPRSYLRTSHPDQDQFAILFSLPANSDTKLDILFHQPISASKEWKYGFTLLPQPGISPINFKYSLSYPESIFLSALPSSIPPAVASPGLLQYNASITAPLRLEYILTQ